MKGREEGDTNHRLPLEEGLCNAGEEEIGPLKGGLNLHLILKVRGRGTPISKPLHGQNGTIGTNLLKGPLLLLKGVTQQGLDVIHRL